MPLLAALSYWLIVAIWLIVLTTVVVRYLRNPRAFGTTRLLLAVIAIDTTRNLVENTYFGMFFGSRYGLFSPAIGEVLGNPFLLVLPKLLNVAAGCLVLGLLLGRWLPKAMLERQNSEQTADTLRHQATLDGMTGLYNRSYFNFLAESEWDRFRRHQRPLSLLMLDIDRFKSVNDRYGHQVGDRVIMQIANACRDQMRKSDVATRLGGEEFALLLPETQLEAACIVAERLRESISGHVLSLAEGNVSVTVSIGVSEASGARNVLDLLRQSDVALYRAKREGRNRICVFDETIACDGQLEYDGLTEASR